MDTRTTTLTGGSGVIGRAVALELPAESLTCLVHRTPVEVPGVDELQCDLRRQRLGLGELDYDRLVARTTHVVHCAAETDFAAGAATIIELNVGGTDAVLRLVEDAGARFTYVSTAFVARPGGNGTLSEGIGAYLHSKRQAETLVRQRWPSSVIVRPSLVSGDSATGEIARFQGLHLMTSLLFKDQLPLLPVPPDARIDFLPQDVVARAISHSMRSAEPGTDLWVTAGEEATPVERLVDAVMEFAGRHGLTVARPRLVEPDIVDRLIRPVFIPQLARGPRRRFERMLSMMALFYNAEPFQSSLPEIRGLVPSGAAASLEEAYLRGLEHWAAEVGLVPKVTA